MKNIIVALISFLSVGCSLSVQEQARLDKYPECKRESLRLNQSLNRDESNCLVAKEMRAKHEKDMKNRAEEAKKLRQKKAEELALSEERTKAYENSKQGLSDKKTCGSLITQSLKGIAHSGFKSMSFSRTDDGFLTCSALIYYKSAFGTNVRPKVIIFNENNGMMNIYDR